MRALHSNLFPFNQRLKVFSVNRGRYSSGADQMLPESHPKNTPVWAHDTRGRLAFHGCFPIEKLTYPTFLIRIDPATTVYRSR